MEFSKDTATMKATTRAMPQDLNAIIETVRLIFAAKELNLEQGLNVLIALIAEIEDDLDADQRADFRSALITGLDIQVAHLASQQNPTIN
jgi:hypothetical protein